MRQSEAENVDKVATETDDVMSGQHKLEVSRSESQGPDATSQIEEAITKELEKIQKSAEIVNQLVDDSKDVKSEEHKLEFAELLKSRQQLKPKQRLN